MLEEYSQLQTISYKDPAGFILKQEDGYYRHVTYVYKNEYDLLINSGLYDELVNAHLLIPHEEVNGNKDYYKVLFPQQIPFISYPFEWSFSQWQVMAVTYIKINEIALKYGMILKDANPYNFIFHKGHCLLLDTISFDFYNDGEPWNAYRHFCEEILSPLALMKYNDITWGKLSRTSLSGFQLSFVSKELKFKSKFNLCCLLHIHGHANFSKKNDGKLNKKSGLDTKKIVALLALLKNSISRWKCPHQYKSIWDNYYKNDIEDKKYLADKEITIKKWLSELHIESVIDLGANTGKFSFIAANVCKQVIAVESDPACVEHIYQHTQLNKLTNIITVIADITQPSPGLGWANTEKITLLNRLSGDVVMLLALIHHLCISKNIPLNFVAKMSASMTKRYVIAEFVPKSDSKTQLLLNARTDIFTNYTEDCFIASFTEYFTLIKMHQCQSSGRKLYLWAKK